MGYRKSSVRTHNTGPCGGPYYPAVNVKCYDWPDTQDIMARFKCSSEVAERAGRWAWESAQERFWEDAKEQARETFGVGVTVYSAGRSGGWLIIEGLQDIENWDARDLSTWRGFESRINQTVKAYTELDPLLDDINANRWAEENSEQYNFRDTPKGTVCLADVEKCAHCA